MATLAINPDNAQDTQPQQALEQRGTEDVSQKNPTQGAREQRLAQLGITPDIEQMLLDVRRRHKRRWSMQRRAIVREILRKIEYLKGNQYYNFDNFGFSWYDPFQAGVATTGSQQDNDESYIYRRVTNIIQWFERVLVSSLSAAMPNTRFWPANAQSDQDNDISTDASLANAWIERQNDARTLLQQGISYLSLAGHYFRYSRYVRENQGGEEGEEYDSIQMQEREVLPNRFNCPTCGYTTPADQAVTTDGQGVKCLGCGGQMGQQDYFPALTMQMPVVSGTDQSPKGYPKQSMFNGLHVDVAPDLDDQKGPLYATPILDLSLEMDVGALRTMFPDCWEMFQMNSDAGSSDTGDGELDRTARLRSLTPAWSSWLLKPTSATTTSGLPTYSRCWFKPEAFNVLDEKVKADKLRNLFPDGVCMASVDEKIVDVRQGKLLDEWTWCGTRTGLGAYPPAILDPAMDMQDRLNDVDNTLDEFYDRCASPGGFADSRYLGKGLNGRFLPPGSWMPVKVRAELGQDLSKAFFQPKIELSESIHNFRQNLIQMAQMLVGITPQMWGGSTPEIETASGQEQALNVASGIMHQYWERIRAEHAEAAKIAVVCLAKNATEDITHVIQGDGPGNFDTQIIRIANLKAGFNTYPEADQGYPVDFEQQKQVFLQLLTSGSTNPAILEMFDDLANRRLAIKYLAPAGTEDPKEDPWKKALADVTRLVSPGSQPTMQMQVNPQTGQSMQVSIPSVQPDKILDDLEVDQQVAIKYAQKNYAQLQQQPLLLENLRAYVRVAAQFAQEKAMEQAPPPPGPPPGAGPQGPPQGAGA